MTDDTVMALVAKAKARYGITWTDDDEVLADFVKEGAYYLESQLTDTIDFGTNLNAVALLMDYVRYARNNATDEYQQNYLKQIRQLRHLNNTMRHNQRKSGVVYG